MILFGKVIWFNHSDSCGIVYDPTFNPELSVSPTGSICTGNIVQLQFTVSAFAYGVKYNVLGDVE